MPDFPDSNKAKPMVSPAAMSNYPCGIPMPASAMPASFGDPPMMPFGGFDGGFDGMMPFGDFGDFGDADPFGRRHVFHHHIHVHHHFHHFPMGGRPFGF